MCLLSQKAVNVYLEKSEPRAEDPVLPGCLNYWTDVAGFEGMAVQPINDKHVFCNILNVSLVSSVLNLSWEWSEYGNLFFVEF